MIQTLQHGLTFALAPEGVEDWHALEFTLADAEKRHDKDPGFYSAQFGKMLDSALKDHTSNATRAKSDPWAWVIEETTYGSISYEIGYDHAGSLSALLEVAADTCAAWAKRFNVAKMKKD